MSRTRNTDWEKRREPESHHTEIRALKSKLDKRIGTEGRRAQLRDNCVTVLLLETRLQGLIGIQNIKYHPNNPDVQ